MNKEIPLKKETPWESFLAENESALSAHVLDTWLRPIRFEGHKNTKVTLAVPDQFFRDWLTDHYLDFIQEGLSKKLETPIKIEWEIDPSLTTPGNTLTSPTKPEEIEEAEAQADQAGPVAGSLHEIATGMGLYTLLLPSRTRTLKPRLRQTDTSSPKISP